LMVGAVLIFSKRIRHALGLPNLAARLPMGEQILRIGRATVAMRQHKTKVACCLGMTFVLQFVVMYSAAMMAWALGMVGSAVYFIAYVAIGFLIGAIPISPPQAIGVMEAFYVQFFTQGGLNTASQAVTLALGVRLIQLVWALPGVLVPLLGAHLPSKEELEHLNDDSGENGSSEPAEAVDSADPGATDAGRE